MEQQINLDVANIDENWTKTFESEDSQKWLDEMTQKALSQFESGMTLPL